MVYYFAHIVNMQYHEKSIAQVVKALHTDPQKGLSTVAAKKILEKNGSNELPDSSQKLGRLTILLEQFKSPLIIILLLAGFISGFLGEVLDMIIILFTAFFNAGVGFVQENKANQALEKLRSMVTYDAQVIRDGQKVVVPSDQLVVGDILLLFAGDRIQADGRIIESAEFSVNESALTGESDAALKDTQPVGKDVPVADQTSMCFRGTSVLNGRAKVVVTHTGPETQIGKIAALVKDTEEKKTPLQKQLASLAHAISYLVIAIASSLFLLGVFAGRDRYSMLELFETSIAVAVAAIPEGLVITLTVILSIGMQFILKRKALVRKLVAAETLGSVSVICTDKTGTLTEGKMEVTRVITTADDVNFEELKLVSSKEGRHDDVIHVLEAAYLASDARVHNPQDPQESWIATGETTEIAIAKAALRAGLDGPSLDRTHKRMSEIPFTSERKYMAVVCQSGVSEHMYIKGAAEVILEKATAYMDGGSIKKLTKAKRKWFEDQEKELTNKGLRVLAVAEKSVARSTELNESQFSEVTLVGLIAFSDPLRSDVKETLSLAQRAGIHIAMITGDHARTARAIAEEIGLPVNGKQVMEGKELERLTDAELKKKIRNITVFARVDPKHKIRIVQALQASGEVVAMTGDGVNDAPALKGADIGVALGSGTDVAKETADMVLLDDSFSTIVSAIEEGRGIYQNIRKVVLYLLSGSFAEVVLIAGSMLLGLPLPVTPAQILWVNIVEDAFPTMALAFDKGEKENMQDPPRPKNTSILDKEVKSMIVLKSIFANIALFGIFLYFLRSTGDIQLVRTIVFVGFAIDALFYIFSIRSLRHMLWKINPFDNGYLIGAVCLGWVMLLSAIYFPPLQILLKTVPLSAYHWGVMITFGLFNLCLIEIIKAVYINKNRVPANAGA